ncbi:hypothetical protein G7068_09480 [Leucobacter viscericola]|uniref:Uncharacterized protein n=1 Tax=Leucobacter viscericola TaxID=2714935 RepID=A0A6G7XFN2_9MICO|nr:hypothetical protein [Leucobacter viscericola]QIK63404.1 hypothetical protein G7068_09480 [Leucobacter viscericola]
MNLKQKTSKTAKAKVPAAIGTAIGFVVLLNGCSTSVEDTSPGDGPRVEDSVSIEAYSNVTAELDFERGTASLPLDPYLVNGDDEFFAKATHADFAYVERCVAKHGFTYLSNIDWSAVEKPENQLFGEWSVPLAQQYGLEAPSNSGIPKVMPSQAEPAIEEAASACMDEAKARAQNTAEFLESPHVDSDIEVMSYDLTLAHPEAKAAINKRSECVKKKGIVLEDDGYLAESYYEQDPAAQIKAATVFAECQVSSGAVQKLFDLYARYQAAYIDKQEAQLGELLKQKQTHEAELDRMIEGGS